VAGGFVYLSTSDPQNHLYRVELGDGKVVELGSAGHAGGEGEGIDVTPLAGGRLHTLTVGRDTVSVYLADFEVPVPRRTGNTEQVLIIVTIAVTLAATIAVVALTRRRWRTRTTA
jgi:hypothetical protein